MASGLSAHTRRPESAARGGNADARNFACWCMRVFPLRRVRGPAVPGTGEPYSMYSAQTLREGISRCGPWFEVD